jgi:hypothetical protein
MEKDSFRFDATTHSYYLGNEKLAGVSSILRYAGFNDMSFVNAEVLQKAQGFGNAGHLMTAYYDKRTLDEKALDENLVPYLSGYKKFLNDYEVNVLEIEMPVYSKKWKCAGMLDRIAELNWKGKRVLSLPDLKFTATMSSAIKVQTAGYRLMFQEMTGKRIQQRLGVQILPDTYKVFPYDDVIDERTFLACLTIRAFKKLNNIKPTYISKGNPVGVGEVNETN